PPPRPKPHPSPGPSTFDAPAMFDLPPGGPVPTKKKRGRAVTVTVLAVVVLAGLIVWLTTRSGDATAGPAPAARPGTIAPPPGTTQPQVPETPSRAVPPVAPNLVGKSIDEAQDSLPSSIQVQTTDTVDTTHPSGTVIAQNPAAGQPLTGTMTLT